MMFSFGVIDCAFHRLACPIAAVILGLVLDDKAEFNLTAALKNGHGGWTVLFFGPILATKSADGKIRASC